tara:strand:- start:690 stop:1232 length:543 start_codon:yes stop_codon:yes gene_type:complete
MTNFIQKLKYDFNVEKILHIVENLPDINQITLNNRGDNPKDPLTCGSGGLQNWYDIKTYDDIKDKDFHWKYLNEVFKGTYIEEIYNSISENWQIGRARIMKLKSKQCYTYHYDFSKRIHIPLVTNEDCWFFNRDMINYNMDVGGTYLLDTTQNHTAANFGKTTRTHIVMAVHERHLQKIS